MEDGYILRRIAVDQKNKAEPINNSIIGRTDAEPPILWPPDAKSQLIGKGPDAGKDWGQKEKGAAEDKMIRWLDNMNVRKFWEIVMYREAWCAAVHGVTESNMI